MVTLTQPSPTRPPKPEDLPTIVLADDDAALRTALKFLLEIEGFQVETCNSAEALLDLALPPTRACLVVDHLMGGVSGMDALETLRRRGVRLPAILITSAPPAALSERAARAGVQLIEKPLLGDALTRAIRAAI
jgi:two-component system response regulator FixJ